MDILTDRQRKKNILYSACFFIVIVIYHLAIRIDFGDDTYYAHVLDNTGLAAFLINRYYTWSSRLVIEALLVCFVRSPLLWKIADIAVMCLLAYSLYELSHRTSLFMVLAMLIIYPFVEMNTAGWIATTMNYLWPLAFGLYSLLIIDRLTRHIQPKWWEALLSFMALAIGANVEQYCVVHIVLLTLYAVRIIVDRNRDTSLWVLAVHYLISFVSLLFVLTCPGNRLRTASEVVSHMKDFYQKTLIDKLIDGFENTMAGMLSSYNLIFLIFAIFICICVFKKTKQIGFRTIALIPALASPVIQAAALLSRLRGLDFFMTASLLTGNGGATAVTWPDILSYVPLMIYGIIICCVLVSFLVVFDDLFSAIESIVLFGTALASRVIMGFSPTIVPSGSRTFLFCYALVIFIMLKAYGQTERLFSEREKRFGRFILGSAAVCMAAFNIMKIVYRSFDAIVAAFA